MVEGVDRMAMKRVLTFQKISKSVLQCAWPKLLFSAPPQQGRRLLGEAVRLTRLRSMTS